MTDRLVPNQNKSHWSAGWRWLVFLLGFSSIACLLSDFYHLCTMRVFTGFILLPSFGLLCCLAVYDWRRGDGRLARAVLTGVSAGFLAAVAYDVFRLPFVFARQWGIAAIVPPMDLFKVFPRFGAMILGQPLEQTVYSTSASMIGWAYHFSNGAAFGAMYIATIGDARRRHWAWAIVMAVGLELGMLLTPYPQVFQIAVTLHFVVVTMAAHAIFGVCLGLGVKCLAEAPAWLPKPL